MGLSKLILTLAVAPLRSRSEFKRGVTCSVGADGDIVASGGPEAHTHRTPVVWLVHEVDSHGALRDCVRGDCPLRSLGCIEIHALESLVRRGVLKATSGDPLKAVANACL